MRSRNPLVQPHCGTPLAVKRRTGVYCWPKGLHWFFVEVSRYSSANMAVSYTIKSKGRNGAKDRSALMRHKHFSVLMR